MNLFRISFLKRLPKYGLQTRSFAFKADELPSRKILGIQGTDARDFLQGMITNDISHLSENNTCLFTLFLNVQGRVLYDALITRIEEDNYNIECDSSILPTLNNHLKLHKVRRKLDLIPKESTIYALFHSEIDNDFNDDGISNISNSLPTSSILIKDPRVQQLGFRMTLEDKLTSNSHFEICSGEYKSLRYHLGIGEGSQEITRGKSLPFETNCDYLHGISLHKGCYIGQELTARTYHTGVIRKRFMPITLSSNTPLEQNSEIINEKGKTVGKIINTIGKYGLGLMRVKESLKANSLSVGNTSVKVSTPDWWPIESK